MTLLKLFGFVLPQHVLWQLDDHLQSIKQLPADTSFKVEARASAGPYLPD